MDMWIAIAIKPGGKTENSARVLNFVDDLNNNDFQSRMDKVVDSIWGDLDVEHGRYRSDGDAVENNWEENENGEAYRAYIEARRPDILGASAGLQARVEAVNQTYIDRYGWDKETQQETSLNQDAAQQQPPQALLEQSARRNEMGLYSIVRLAWAYGP